MTITSRLVKQIPSQSDLSIQPSKVINGDILVQSDHYAASILCSPDIEKIMNLENETWVPALRATRETILSRLAMNHHILAIHQNNALLGMVGWSYSSFSYEDSPALFPKNFQEFSFSQSVDPSAAYSAFIYNVGVKPSARKKGIGSLLLSNTLEKIKGDGISQVFLDSRMPSYYGSYSSGNELIMISYRFQHCVDEYFITHKMPFKHELALDETVRFYFENGFEPWFMRKGFIQDEASGNIRLICHRAL
jgi:GNAT superfamily N-acetyltransferase